MKECGQLLLSRTLLPVGNNEDLPVGNKVVVCVN